MKLESRLGLEETPQLDKFESVVSSWGVKNVHEALTGLLSYEPSNMKSRTMLEE